MKSFNTKLTIGLFAILSIINCNAASYSKGDRLCAPSYEAMQAMRAKSSDPEAIFAHGQRLYNNGHIKEALTKIVKAADNKYAPACLVLVALKFMHKLDLSDQQLDTYLNCFYNDDQQEFIRYRYQKHWQIVNQALTEVVEEAHPDDQDNTSSTAMGDDDE